MPGKVNPVIPEAVSQAAMTVMGYDAIIAQATAAGSLELNPFLPLIAACLLESLLLLQRSCLMLRRHCVEGIVANEAVCRRHVDSSSAAATALVPEIGYDAACEIAKRAAALGQSVRVAAVDGGYVTGEQRIAIVLVSFPSVPLLSQATPELYRTTYFGPAPSVDSFLREVSYGTVWANGQVFGPFVLDADYFDQPVSARDELLRGSLCTTGWRAAPRTPGRE